MNSFLNIFKGLTDFIISEIMNTNSNKKRKNLSSGQMKKLQIANKLAGSVEAEDNTNIKDLKLQYLIKKHLKNE